MYSRKHDAIVILNQCGHKPANGMRAEIERGDLPATGSRAESERALSSAVGSSSDQPLSSTFCAACCTVASTPLLLASATTRCRSDVSSDEPAVSPSAATSSPCAIAECSYSRRTAKYISKYRLTSTCTVSASYNVLATDCSVLPADY